MNQWMDHSAWEKKVRPGPDPLSGPGLVKLDLAAVGQRFLGQCVLGSVAKVGVNTVRDRIVGWLCRCLDRDQAVDLALHVRLSFANIELLVQLDDQLLGTRQS